MSSSVKVNPSATIPSISSVPSFRLAKSKQDSLLEDIRLTISELELNIMEHHRNELNLYQTMQTQSEQFHDLRASLDVERQRNQRLAKLIRCVDSSTSSSESESYMAMETTRLPQSRKSIGVCESISPLLMQHRYDELSNSYNQCQRQLAKKDFKLRETQYQVEMLQAKYDNLLDEHMGAQKRIEQLCCKYLRLHANKNREISKLKQALGYATQCIMNESNYDKSEKEVLRRNLQLFIRSLKNSVHDEFVSIIKDN